MFNILILPFFAIALGMCLAVFISRQRNATGESLVPPEEDYDRAHQNPGALELQDLYQLAGSLCEQNGLTVKQKLTDSPNESHWIAESKNEFFYGNYVLGFLKVHATHPFATMRDVLEFKDLVKSEGGSKGFFFTTGYFTRDVHQPLEGAKVSLYNRTKILGDLKKG